MILLYLSRGPMRIALKSNEGVYIRKLILFKFRSGFDFKMIIDLFFEYLVTDFFHRMSFPMHNLEILLHNRFYMFYVHILISFLN